MTEYTAEQLAEILASHFFYGAGAIQAGLRDADCVINLGRPDGWHGYAYLWKNEIWVRVGCRNMTLAAGREYWANKEDRQEVLAALDYAEKIAHLRGWLCHNAGSAGGPE